MKGHRRSQMMVLTQSFWWCVLPCRPRKVMKDTKPESVLSPSPSQRSVEVGFSRLQDVKEKVAYQKGRRISKSIPLALWKPAMYSDRAFQDSAPSMLF